MNTQTILTNISMLLDSFRNSQWRIGNILSKTFPFSYETLSDYALYENLKGLHLNKMTSAIADTPAYYQCAGKSKSIIRKTLSSDVSIYSNTKLLDIKSDTVVDQNSIPIVMVDVDDNIIDARVSGGGFNDIFFETDKNRTTAYSCADRGHYDGRPTGAVASIMIECPDTLLTEVNEEQLKSIIRKYTALGVFPIVTYYSAPAIEN